MQFVFENTRPEMSNEEIIQDLRRVASLVGVTALSIRTYQRYGRYAHSTVKKRFGSWNRALAAAQLQLVSVRDITDEALFDNLREVWIALGRQPRKLELRPPLSRYTFSPYARRFGSLLRAFRAYTEAAQTEDSSIIEPAESSAQNRRTPSLRLRFFVMRRDRFRCVLCG